ncbi:DUF3817 domain-containing protein [Pseudomonas sp. WHRI 8822A]|uniref:DUF3817 domain-containing protein n=1 Tax=Pseudomonas sp. WHRI 8822A TaxID=3162568 RepID=UPI0032F04D27
MRNVKVSEDAPARALIWAARFEGTTLLLLLCIAVPLKHLAGYPQLVSLLGPVHGVAFIIYVSITLKTATEHAWSSGVLLRVLFAALLPFGGFFTARFLQKNVAIKQQE